MAYKFEQAGKTKWRVQINRQGIKVNKVFDSQVDALNYENLIKSNIAKGLGNNNIDLENVEPPLRMLFHDYFYQVVAQKNTSHPNYLYNLRNHKARLLSTLPKVSIRLLNNSAHHKEPLLYGKKFEYGKDYEIGDFLLSSISVHIILAYIQSRRNSGISDGTINRELNYFSVAYKFVPQLYEHITYKIQNPVELITPQQYPKPSRPRKKVIAEKDIELISEHLAQLANKQHYMVWYCCLSFGCRKSEAINILYENINWEEREIWLKYTKNGHPRMMPVNQDFLDMIKEHIGIRSSGKVFTITQYSLRQAWERCLKETGLYGDVGKENPNRPIFHTLRNRFITNHLKAQTNSSIVTAESLGLSVRTIEEYATELAQLEVLRKWKQGIIPTDEELMMLVGHKDKATTQRYLALLQTMSKVSS